MEKISKTKNRQRNFQKRGLIPNHHAMEAIDNETKKKLLPTELHFFFLSTRNLTYHAQKTTSTILQVTFKVKIERFSRLSRLRSLFLSFSRKLLSHLFLF